VINIFIKSPLLAIDSALKFAPSPARARPIAKAAVVAQAAYADSVAEQRHGADLSDALRRYTLSNSFASR
jgi:hypothetical protein